MESPITTTGTILAVLNPGIYKVRLPNGKELVCHLPRKSSLTPDDIAVDAQVELHFTPYDMEKARIAARVS